MWWLVVPIFLTNDSVVVLVSFQNSKGRSRILLGAPEWRFGGSRFPLQTLPSNSRELTFLARKGLPVKRIWLPKQDSILEANGSGCCISVFSKAPHPNAAKLFVNWFLSKEGQTLTHTKIPFLERSSLRNDIPFGEVTPDQRRAPGAKFRFPDAEPGYGALQEEAQKWVMKIWESRQR